METGNNIIHSFMHDGRSRTFLTTTGSLIFNAAYAAYNCILAYIGSSAWFYTMFLYYLVLAAMRFKAVSAARMEHGAAGIYSGSNIARFTGVMLMVLGAVIAVVVWYSTVNPVGHDYGTIIMITIATYTFTKIILAIVNLVKVKAQHSPLLTAIRYICLADAAVSMLSLQRSMLVTFEGMSPPQMQMMNRTTGTAVCLLVFILGLLLLKDGSKISDRGRNMSA